MKLLIITQKVDKQDDVLGFFHRWIEVFAEQFESVVVICLYKGDVQLSKHVHVVSLGKEEGVSRFIYVRRFFRYIWTYRTRYDAVFVHMNAEYVLLGAWIWRLLGKKLALWYNHTYGTWKARLAFFLVDIVFHTSPFAFSAGRKKSCSMPAGIDTNLFKPDTSIYSKTNSLLYVGRLSSVKNVDTLTEAVHQLVCSGTQLSLGIYGSPGDMDKEYFQNLKKFTYPLEEQKVITYYGSMPNFRMPEIYNYYEVLVNLTPRGNYDKTILEAMACGKIALVSSEAFTTVLPPVFLFKERNSADLADKIKSIFNLSSLRKKEYGEQLRQYVVDNHSLTKLARVLEKQLRALYV